ncbi:hypothetical protein PYCC9005_001712 [Savitreella phatthalungensis]
MTGNHLVCTFPLQQESRDRLAESGLFESIEYWPSTYSQGTKHPKAQWSHIPADIPEEVWQRTTHLYTFFATPDTFDLTPNLRLMQSGTAGFEHLLVQPFFRTIPQNVKDEKKLNVAGAAGVHATTIAEYVLMNVINFYHKARLLEKMQQTAHWNREPYVPPGTINGTRELRGKTMGIVGYGSIGRECARLASAFGMKIVAANSRGVKTPHHGFRVEGTGDVDGNLPEAWYSTANDDSLREMFGRSDILVLACPLTDATRHIINVKTLGWLKDGAFMVNVSRGGTVDQEALLAALDGERLAGAALDVSDPEPLPDNHPFWRHPKVNFTPHISGSGEYYEARCMDLLMENTRRLQEGKSILNRVELS